MIDFRTPQPSDKAWVDALLAQADYRGCDYNFTNLFVWSRAYGQEIAQVNGFLVTHLCGRMGCSYMYPAGSGDLAAAIDILAREADERRQPLRLVCLTTRQMEELDRLMPGRFAYEADRDGFDYLYDIDRLAQDVGGGILATLPSEADFRSPEVGKYVEKYMRGVASVPTEDRMRMIRLVEVMTGGVALVESMHGAGSPQAQKIMYSKLSGLESKKKAAMKIAGVDPSKYSK